MKSGMKPIIVLAVVAVIGGVAYYFWNKKKKEACDCTGKTACSCDTKPKT